MTSEETNFKTIPDAQDPVVDPNTPDVPEPVDPYPVADPVPDPEPFPTPPEPVPQYPPDVQF